MTKQTEIRSGRVKKSNTPIHMRFSELLVLFDEQKVLTADGRHWLIDDHGNILRPIEVCWGRDQ